MNGTASSASFAAFSVDVEDYFQVEALRSFCPRPKWESFEDRVVPNTERLLTLLDQESAKGTFFILGWIAKRHPDLIKRIAGQGHEVASHGLDHELVYNQDPDAFRMDVRDSRKLLQDLSGQEINGYRAPSYTIMKKTQWALPILAEEGYRYDSSIFPISRRRYGMPGANRWPHHLGLEEFKAFVEFPISTVRFGPLNVPATGGAYLRLLPLFLQKRFVTQILRENRPLVVNVHPWELDPGQPRFPVGLRTRWTHYHNLDQTESRLQSLLSLSSFRTQTDVLTDLGLL